MEFCGKVCMMEPGKRESPLVRMNYLTYCRAPRALLVAKKIVCAFHQAVRVIPITVFITIVIFHSIFSHGMSLAEIESIYSGKYFLSSNLKRNFLQNISQKSGNQIAESSRSSSIFKNSKNKHTVIFPGFILYFTFQSYIKLHLMCSFFQKGQLILGGAYILGKKHI